MRLWADCVRIGRTCEIEQKNKLAGIGNKAGRRRCAGLPCAPGLIARMSVSSTLSDPPIDRRTAPRCDARDGRRRRAHKVHQPRRAGQPPHGYREHRPPRHGGACYDAGRGHPHLSTPDGPSRPPHEAARWRTLLPDARMRPLRPRPRDRRQMLRQQMHRSAQSSENSLQSISTSFSDGARVSH